MADDAFISEMRCLFTLMGIRVLAKPQSHTVGSLDWLHIEVNDGNTLLVLERTYRGGVRVLVSPTSEDIAKARRDPWLIWNDSRTVAPCEAAWPSSEQKE